MSSTARSFGSELGNIMTASQTAENTPDVLLVKNDLSEAEILADTSMEKSAENGGSSKPGALMSNVLAVEVYSLINHNNSNEEDLLEDLEDLLDEGFLISENVWSAGVEYEVKSKEKRGGMTLYTMTDGTKIGNRDLKRKKGLNKDYLKKLLEKDASFDGKHWIVSEEVTKTYQLKQKLAPIFNMTPKSAKKKEESSSSDDESPRIVFQGRASAGGQPSKTGMQKKLEKEKEKAEKKRIQEEEKKKKQEEKKKEKEEKKKEKAPKKETKKETKNGKLDSFLKKTEDVPSTSPKTAAIFSKQRAANRFENGIKKLEDSWNKRDLEAFNEACTWCEKQFTLQQVQKIENQLWQYSVQKLVDKTKDQNALKKLKANDRVTYRQKNIEPRRELYRKMDPRVRLHFTEEWSQDDLIIASTAIAGEVAQLALPTTRHEFASDSGDFFIECMEVSQFIVAIANVFGFQHDVSVLRLKTAIETRRDGFADCLYRVYEMILGAFLMDERFSKLAHSNVRLVEYKCTELTITEMFRAFFIGEFELSPKQKKTAEAEDNAEKTVEMDAEDLAETNDENNLIPEEERQKFLSIFNAGTLLADFTASQHISLLQLCQRIMLRLDVLRDFMQRDYVSDELKTLRKKASRVADAIETASKELGELPPAVTEDEMATMSRTKSRDAAVVEKKRERLEKKLEDLRVESEQTQLKINLEKANVQRVLRTFFIGEDRHFRRYYMMDYNSDAGIWIQDFGKTSFEEWALECSKLGIKNFENEPIEKLPNIVEKPIEFEKWYKIIDEESLKNLEKSLLGKGKREKITKNYLKKSMDDIMRSIRKYADKKSSISRSVSPENEQTIEEEQEEELEDEEEENATPKIVFTGEFATICDAIRTLCLELEDAQIFVRGKTAEFEQKMSKIADLERMKEVFVEFVESVDEKFIMSRLAYKEAIANNFFSVLAVPRFCERIRESITCSALHLYLGYFDSRINRERTIKNQPCKVCSRKTGKVTQKLMCRTCAAVYHANCCRPRVAATTCANDEEFRQTWQCSPCSREQAARLEREAKAAAEAEAVSDEEDLEAEEEEAEDVEAEEDDEEWEERPRKRKAKQMAGDAIREAVAHFDQRAPRASVEPPPAKKRPVVAAIREFWESLEEANPRLFKSLIKMNVGKGVKGFVHLNEIENKLSQYGAKSVPRLRSEILTFLNAARDELEDNGASHRKLDEVEELISKFDVE